MTIDSSYFDPPPTSPFDDDLTLGQKLGQTFSPASAQSLVPSPPDAPPQTQPGRSTPQTGSLATPPQQAVAKNLDTAAGRQSYNVQPAQPVSSPSGVQPVNQNPVAANTPQPAGPPARPDGRRVVVRDLNGNPAGALAARMGNGSTAPTLQPVQAATGAVQPVQPAGRLAGRFAQSVQAYNSSAAPAQYAASQTPASTDSSNPDPTASLRPGGSNIMPASPNGIRPAPNPMSAVSAVQPAQVNAPSQMDQDQATRNALISRGTGVHNIQNPWLRAAAGIGDVAFSAIAPNIAQYTKGTTLNYQRNLGIANQNVAQDTQQAQSAAAIADTQSQADERRAKIAQDIANAGKADRWDPNAVKTVNTAEGVKAFNPDTNQWEVIGGSPDKLQEGERPLGSTIPNLNKTLSDRYQVLNPGKAVPSQYQLPPTATQKDYDRVDKALAGVEGAQGTQAQRQTSNAMREQAMAATEAARANAGNQKDFQATERGRQVLDKAETQYRTAQQGVGGLRDMVSMADAGNKMSAQMLPLEGALEITTAQGVHRINKTEVDQFAGGGSLFDQIAGKLGKLTKGQPIPANIRGDIRKLADAQEKGAYSTYKGAYDSATKRYGLKDEEPLPAPGGKSAAPASTGGFNWNDHPKVNP